MFDVAVVGLLTRDLVVAVDALPAAGGSAPVTRRPRGAGRRGAQTALVVDVVESGGRRRLLEHVPPELLLTPADVRAAEPVLRSSRAVLVDL